MSENTLSQTQQHERARAGSLNELEQDVLTLFRQLTEADQRHIVRLLQALRETSA